MLGFVQKLEHIQVPAITVGHNGTRKRIHLGHLVDLGTGMRAYSKRRKHSSRLALLVELAWASMTPWLYMQYGFDTNEVFVERNHCLLFECFGLVMGFLV